MAGTVFFKLEFKGFLSGEGALDLITIQKIS